MLGRTGKNFGAGMSGGLAFVYDPDARLGPLCNEDVAGDLSPLQSEEVRLPGRPAALLTVPSCQCLRMLSA